MIVDLALADASARKALSGRESGVALTRLTDVNGVNGTACRTEETILALVTVDASRVVLTVQTDTSTSFVAMNVCAETFFGSGLVEDTVLTVTIAVALLTDEWIVECSPTPLVLVIPGTALVTLGATGVVLTATGDLVWVIGRALVALGCVTIAHTLATNVNVLDTVKVTTSDCRVLVHYREQMS